MAQLELSNIVTVSVSASPAGIGAYNTSNLAIFTRETAAMSFGSDGFKIYLEPTEVGTDFGTDSVTYAMALAVFSQAPNILAGGGYLVVILFQSAETIAAAVTRTQDLVQYFGVMSAEITTSTPLLAGAAVIQALNKIAFWVQRDTATVEAGGLLDLIRTGDFTQSRGLFYGASNDLDAIVMMASYGSRALSTDFSGSNTTLNMQLKDLIGVQPDPIMTQTLFTKCKNAGADIYASFQGVPKVACSGANRFYDQVYNEQWFVGAIQVAIFNTLAESSTKVPQTEQGISLLTSACRQVCEQAVGNQYVAPGVWNSPNTFGRLNDFLRNIQEFGYYIYSTPIALQSPTDRANRIAPLIQIALKEAGAVDTASIIVNINP
jgi:Protein of unknown function (DUF3383)